uniref:BtpA/SgcQ family protein n=1 Tax=Heterorhabditis bacteriophora TaxID=37862 RepID=A0A1I7WSH0_HETBA
MKKAIEVIRSCSQPYVFGMIHVPALPGTPRNKLSVPEIINVIKKETEIYAEAHVDGIIIENMHDIPYSRRPLGPEIISTMTMASQGLDLIRAECFVFSHVADEGWMDGCAGELLRYQKVIGAEKVAIITDIKKKHSSHSITADISIGSMAEAAQFFLADGVILTGRCTGDQANPKDISGMYIFLNSTWVIII